MANPNIVNVSTINGQTAVAAVTTTATALVSNSASSGKIIKINLLMVSNITTTNGDITVDLYRSSTARRLVKDTPVPTTTTLDILNKPLYLLEGDSLRVTADANSKLEVVCSYEEIS